MQSVKQLNKLMYYFEGSTDILICSPNVYKDHGCQLINCNQLFCTNLNYEIL
jgi:hypothetical protein